MFAVSVEDLDTSRELVERLDVEVPILADTSTSVAKVFEIYDLPGGMGPFSTHSFWLIDESGTIRYRDVSTEMHVPFAEVEAAVARFAA